MRFSNPFSPKVPKLKISQHEPWLIPERPSLNSANSNDSSAKFPTAKSLSPVLLNDEAVVAVIGVGYVGEQLAAEFGEKYKVIAFDVSEKRLETIRPAFRRRSSVTLTAKPSALKQATHFLIAVPTLLLPDESIDTSYLRSALATICQHARRGATVVVESSVAVGMTRQLLSELLVAREWKGGMSPERVDPGRVSPAYREIPKIISGLDDVAPGSLDSIAALYSRVFNNVVKVSSPEVAEMTKLYENCQRMVNVAYACEMADACEQYGINPYEVCEAAASKPFGYMPYSPGLGVGGHCIPVNPFYLFHNSHENQFPVLRLATERTKQRPARMADRIMQQSCIEGTKLNKRGRSPRFLVIGVGFKRGESVLSNSPGVALIHRLVDDWGAKVEFADPLVQADAIPQVPKLDETKDWTVTKLEGYDAIVVAIEPVGLDMTILDQLKKAAVVKYHP